MESNQKRDLANELTEWLATRSIGIEMLYQIGVLSKDTFIDRVDGEMMMSFRRDTSISPGTIGSSAQKTSLISFDFPHVFLNCS